MKRMGMRDRGKGLSAKQVSPILEEEGRRRESEATELIVGTASRTIRLWQR